MTATIKGGKKAAESNKKLYGSDFYKRIGQIGGSAKVQKGFAKSGKSESAGSTGGKRSKIGYKFISEDNDAMYYIRKSDGVSVTFVK